uniref:Uncharacterized protein n=1 Tax=Cannabis sativa TaxID=3483 RepID=A0A803QTM4_CANSA
MENHKLGFGSVLNNWEEKKLISKGVFVGSSITLIGHRPRQQQSLSTPSIVHSPTLPQLYLQYIYIYNLFIE